MARDPASYAGREQAHVKHYLLESYLERLIYKTAHRYDHIVYVDGYSGPWLSQQEDLGDTSFGIALAALRKAKETWKGMGRNVKMSAILVEKSRQAFERLEKVPPKYPDIELSLIKGDFRENVGTIVSRIPEAAFSFVLIDPKGWRINLRDLAPLIARPNAEVVFNFMFEFINRAAAMSDRAVATALDELIPTSNWRANLSNADSPHARKAVLISAFSESLANVGCYPFVAETPVLRPIKDRTLYSLIFGTRKPVGLEVFRDCQVKTLVEQSNVRGRAKIDAAEVKSGQTEMFESLHDLGADPSVIERAQEIEAARRLVLELVPLAPEHVTYGEVWPQVLARRVVRKTEVGAIAATLRKEGDLTFLDWGPRKSRPADEYRVCRPTALNPHPSSAPR